VKGNVGKWRTRDWLMVLAYRLSPSDIRSSRRRIVVPRQQRQPGRRPKLLCPDQLLTNRRPSVLPSNYPRMPPLDST
jgi:hypothetical protein